MRPPNFLGPAIPSAGFNPAVALNIAQSQARHYLEAEADKFFRLSMEASEFANQSDYTAAADIYQRMHDLLVALKERGYDSFSIEEKRYAVNDEIVFSSYNELRMQFLSGNVDASMNALSRVEYHMSALHIKPAHGEKITNFCSIIHRFLHDTPPRIPQSQTKDILASLTSLEYNNIIFERAILKSIFGQEGPINTGDQNDEPDSYSILKEQYETGNAEYNDLVLSELDKAQMRSAERFLTYIAQERLVDPLAAALNDVLSEAIAADSPGVALDRIVNALRASNHVASECPEVDLGSPLTEQPQAEPVASSPPASVSGPKPLYKDRNTPEAREAREELADCNIMDWLRAIWREELKAKSLTRAILRGADPSADVAVQNWLRKKPLPDDIYLPTRRGLNDEALMSLTIEDVREAQRLSKAAQRRRTAAARRPPHP